MKKSDVTKLKFNIHEAKTRLSEILLKVEKGFEVTVCRDGVPVARIVPLKKRARVIATNPKLQGVVLKESFFDPLDEDSWPETLR